MEKFNELKKLSALLPEQRSKEWLEQRSNAINASEIYGLSIGNIKNKTDGHEIAMQWGTAFESIVDSIAHKLLIEMYGNRYCGNIEHIGSIPHSTRNVNGKIIRGSPDGYTLVGDDIINLEYKCPFNGTHKTDNIYSYDATSIRDENDIPISHISQMNCVMDIIGNARSLYVNCLFRIAKTPVDSRYMANSYGERYLGDNTKLLNGLFSQFPTVVADAYNIRSKKSNRKSIGDLTDLSQFICHDDIECVGTYSRHCGYIGDRDNPIWLRPVSVYAGIVDRDTVFFDNIIEKLTQRQ